MCKQEEKKLYEPLLDELNYEIERCLDKFRTGDRRLPALAVIGLFVTKAIEYSLENQGLNYDILRQLQDLYG